MRPKLWERLEVRNNETWCVMIRREREYRIRIPVPTVGCYPLRVEDYNGMWPVAMAMAMAHGGRGTYSIFVQQAESGTNNKPQRHMERTMPENL
mmetsp:Transcript_34116/g.78682  ORF Transcript_34116/g.78682 Transcript_34116/m.78682 type:complete len:94 (-) Transcript_34116:118-399(-)